MNSWLVPLEAGIMRAGPALAAEDAATAGPAEEEVEGALDGADPGGLFSKFIGVTVEDGAGVEGTVATGAGFTSPSTSMASPPSEVVGAAAAAFAGAVIIDDTVN